jgi:hypothetical protein
LVVSYLSVDLNPEDLVKVSNTRNIRHVIPLLNSNSSDAKYMRIAASLQTAAEAFARHIFQPTYLLEDNSLCQILSDLAQRDPVRESHIRAVLLPIPAQRESVNQRIRRCTEEINFFLGPMILINEREEFSHALKKACEQVCGDWARLQNLRGRVEVSFHPDDADKWTLLSSCIQEDVRKVKKLSESGSTSSDGQNGAKRGGFPSVELEQVEQVIWPSFIFRTADGHMTVQNCVVLSCDQLARARSEQGTHREKRRNSRMESVSMANNDGNKGEKSFLSGNSAGKPNGG